jgi:hypothetical protein
VKGNVLGDNADARIELPRRLTFAIIVNDF